jgi:HAD superfamily hydrolase (TIGR01549 family)
MGIIFDLDQTIIDSNIALQERKNREWNKVYDLIPSFVLYEGIFDLIAEINSNGIPTCIVTTSPSTYCDKVLSHHGLPFVNRVCYHDTHNKKPHPEPMLLALKKMGVAKDEILSIGDDPKDIIASKGAGIISVAAIWGCGNAESLLETAPTYICNKVSDLRKLIFPVSDVTFF